MISHKQKTIRDFSNTRNPYYFFLLFLLTFTGATQAQQLSLDLDKLWKGEYDPERLEAIRSMNDGSHYTVLEQDQANNSSAIVS